MRYNDYEEKTNKIPYDKEPIHRQSNYQKAKPATNNSAKVGRNDPCPCGSGKKYKQCCGKA